jgi:hypothetical protein
VRAAIDAIRADPRQYERYAADPQILAVLQKMRRLHAAAQANGQRTVNIEDMLTQPGVGQEARDAERQTAIEAACAAQMAAAAAAAAEELGSAAEAAQAAYDAALRRFRQAAAGGGKGDAAAGAAPSPAPASKLAAAGGKAAASILRQRIAGDSSSGGEAAGAAEAAGAELQQQEQDRRRRQDEEAGLPEWMQGGFSWKVGAAAVGAAVVLCPLLYECCACRALMLGRCGSGSVPSQAACPASEMQGAQASPPIPCSPCLPGPFLLPAESGS